MNEPDTLPDFQQLLRTRRRQARVLRRAAGVLLAAQMVGWMLLWWGVDYGMGAW
ncbi:MAG: hypothetical protein AAFV53_08115 [Myxococcota bacterium]